MQCAFLSIRIILRCRDVYIVAFDGCPTEPIISAEYYAFNNHAFKMQIIGRDCFGTFVVTVIYAFYALKQNHTARTLAPQLLYYLFQRSIV